MEANKPKKVTAITVAQAFRDTVARVPDRVAFRTLDDSVSLTWAQARDRSDSLAGGLAKLGLKRGETIALMLNNRPEFHLADLAAITLGATSFSIYQTLPAEEIVYVVADSGARIAIVEEAFLAVFSEARKSLPSIEHVIVLGASATGCIAWDDVEGSNPGFDIDSAWRQTAPDDLLTLIYTSGTTGHPKGVQLSHHNLLSAVTMIEQVIDFPDGSKVISWLPSAHIAERCAHHYIPIAFGMTVTCCDNPREITSYLPKVKPTWFFAVPRIWEKLKAGLETMLVGAPQEQREHVTAALADATEKVVLEQAGKPVPKALAERCAKADAEIFAGLRAMLGFDEAIAVHVGAAPTAPEVLIFFHAIGIELAELWGMSETCGAGTVNPPGRVKIGTVGPPGPGVEIRLADDGELLIRGDIVMVGYRNKPEQTAETITADGWLLTGDIGEIDEDGYLSIIDRKKELIINAAGKNMSPSNIESSLKVSSPLIGLACAIGDARPYNTALLLLDGDFAPAWAAQQGIEDLSLGALASNPVVVAEVQLAVDRANQTLARVEGIKKFTLIGEDWLPGGDELTPTMKLKRKPISAKYADAIEAMYAK